MRRLLIVVGALLLLSCGRKEPPKPVPASGREVAPSDTAPKEQLPPTQETAPLPTSRNGKIVPMAWIVPPRWVHPCEATAVAFAGSARAVTGGRDGTVVLWDVRTGARVRDWRIHRDRVRSLAYHAGEKRIVSSGDDGRICWWDPETDAPPGEIREAATVVTAQPGAARFLTAEETALRLRDAKSGAIVAEWTSGGWARCVAFRADGARAVSAHGDGTIRLWDAGTGKEIRSWKGAPALETIRFAGDRTVVAAGTGGIQSWNAETGEPEWNLETMLTLGYREVWALTEDGKRFCYALGHSTGSAASILEVGKKEETATSKCVTAPAVAAWSPDGTRLLFAGQDGAMELWDGAGRRVGSAQRPTAVAVFPEGNRAVAGFGDGAVQCIDLETGKVTGEVQAVTGPVSRLAPGRTGSLVFVASQYGSSLVDFERKEVRKRYEGAPGGETAVISADGSKIFFDHRGEAWNLDSGAVVRGTEYRLFSGDGRTGFISSGWEEVSVRDLETGAEKSKWKCDVSLDDGIPSPDGSRLLLWIGEWCGIWETAGGAWITSRRIDGVSSEKIPHVAAWTTDGRYLFLSGRDGVTRLLDGNGEIVDVLPRGATALAATRDRVLIADEEGGIGLYRLNELTTSDPEGLKPWRTMFGKYARFEFLRSEGGRFELLRTFGEHPYAVTGVAWSADGSVVYSVSTRKLLGWEAGSPDRVRLSREIPGACLSADGGRLLIGGDDEVTVLSIPGHERVCEMDGPSRSVVLVPERRFAIGRSRYGSVALMDLEKKEAEDLPDASDRTNCVAAHPKGALVFAGDWEGNVTVWDLSKKVASWKAHAGGVGAVHAGSKLATWGADGFVRVWEYETWKEVSRFPVPGDPLSESRVLVVDESRNLAATNAPANVLSLWDLETGRRLDWIVTATNPTCLAARGDQLLVGVGSGHVMLYRWR